MLVFISVIYSTGYDDNKSEVILNSFPIDRKDIVRGKYVTLIIFILINCVLIFSFTNIMKIVGYKTDGRAANFLDIIVAINVILIFFSIYYLLYFKLGDLKMFNLILWILVFAGPNILVKIIEGLETRGLLDKIANLNLKQINLYTLMFSIVIYYISLQISKHIYLKREF